MILPSAVEACVPINPALVQCQTQRHSRIVRVGGEYQIEQAVVVQVRRLARDATGIQTAECGRLDLERPVPAVHKERRTHSDRGSPAAVQNDDILPAVVVEVAEHRVGVVGKAIFRFYPTLESGGLDGGVEEVHPLTVVPCQRRQAGGVSRLLKPEVSKVLPESPPDIFRPRSKAVGCSRPHRQHIGVAVVVRIGEGNIRQARSAAFGPGLLCPAVVTQSRLAGQTIADDPFVTQSARFSQHVLPAEDALAIFDRRIFRIEVRDVDVISLKQVEVAVIIEVDEVYVGAGLVPVRVVVEAAKVRDEISAADVFVSACFETPPRRLIYVEPVMRKPALGVFDIVATDGNIEPTVTVYITEGGLAIVGQFVTDPQFVRDIAKAVP